MASVRKLCCLSAVLLHCAALAHGQAVGGLVEEVGVAQDGGDVTVTVLFGCSLRYLSHSPASSGDLVRVRLAPQPDCGTSLVAGRVPPALDERGVIHSIDIERMLGADVELRIRWTRPEDFVLVSSFDGRGLRFRLIRAEADRGRVTVTEVTGATATFAINLSSSKTPFEPAALLAAAEATGVRTYVSDAVVDEERWYRLRAGPFLVETDARRALAAARAKYPKAWLAIGDEAASTGDGMADAGARVPVMQPQASATLTRPDREHMLRQARSAFRGKDYATAIALLTKLMEQPEFPGRAQALEMLGLARERSGQLAHAKAEFEEYLRRYPEGEAAKRTRKRLRSLAFATSPAGRRAAAAKAGQSPWKTYGGWSQLYRRDGSGFDNGTSSGERTTHSAVLTDGAFAARRRGERYDFAARVSGGYGVDLLQDGPGDQSRVAVMFAELHDQELGWTLRGGRQSGGLGGLLGSFDGAYAGWQVRPQVRLNLHAGFPVESSRSGPTTDRRLYAVSADFGTFGGAWDVSAYALTQDYFGLTDRQAVGAELRYFRPGLTFVGLVDYDVHFGALNDVLLLGTMALPAQWSASINLEHRSSPTLTSRNALIGQSVTRFEQLFGLYTAAEIEQLARDRTAMSDVYTLSLSRPFGERWQWTMDLTGMTLGATPASDGVAATEGTGTDLLVSTQALGYGLFGGGDVSSLGLQFQAGDASSARSLGVNAQFPVGRGWRIGPRLRVDQRQFHSDGSKQLLYAPGLRTELRAKHLSLEFEGGTEFGRRSLDDASEDTTRYYFSLGYRYDF